MQRDLVLRAQAGDHDAFSELAAASIERLLAIARLVVRDDEWARDAVQDALVTAWLRIRGLRDPDKFDAWMHRLLVHACYGTASRERRRRVTELPLLDTDRQTEPDTQHATAVRDHVERAFGRLPVDQRAVLVVHHYLGLADREAAAILDVPIGTMKSRLHRASAAMRAALDAEDRAGAVRQESMA
jgi:RNA polymerase sigma-70 factor, ECF subfamily